MGMNQKRCSHARPPGIPKRTGTRAAVKRVFMADLSAKCGFVLG
jgi:hypothetical protein